MDYATELAAWDARFAGETYFYGTAPNAFLVSQSSRLKPGMEALAVADGEGRNGTWLAEQGVNVLSVDFSSTALAKAQRLAAQRGVSLKTHCANLATWDWGPARFDLVVAIFIQFAAPALREVIFRRIKEVLLPGGILLLQGYRPEQVNYKTGGPPQAENLYAAPLLREAFGDFGILHLAEYDAEIAEGSGHHGMSALIDLVAQK
ncbi:MAG: class I SAM-dependent methyltransferase [Candidatus Methanoperedens sp.]